MTGQTFAEYQTAVTRLRAELALIPDGAPIRLAKRTSNLFRMREASAAPGLDVGAFDGVLHVDVAARTADVLGMTTYEHLVDATLPHGLMPLVVPQLKTITLGGAVTGMGIESSSFRNGCPHESVLEMDVLTGEGQVVTASPTNEHRDLFVGFANSYGTLGYALRLRIELEPVAPYVQLAHERFDDAVAYTRRLDELATHREVEGRSVDFLDGTVFSADEMVVTVGTFVDAAPYTSDYTGNQIYYRSLQHRRRDFLTVRDYLWRWDTDWFWCSRALKVQQPLVRALVPKRYLRSDVYWKLVGFERKHGWVARLDRAGGKPPTEAVIQDVEVPVDRLPEFLEFFHREIGIAPVWICPMRQRDPDVVWDLYAMDPATLYVNVGFWSTVPQRPGQVDGHHNRLIESQVTTLGGRKSLYSDAYYDEAEFWRLYGGSVYDMLKKTYDPDGRLLGLYDKVVRRR